MGLTVQTFEAGPIQTNAYLVGDDESRAALLIDAPRDVTQTLVDAVAAGGWRVELIVLTHAHWDHIADAAALIAAIGAPLAAHPLATDRLAAPGAASADLPFTIPPVTPDRALNDGDEIALGAHVFRVLHVPGHDPAHIALVSASDRVFLGGDVIFPGGHGTTEIPGSDQAIMDRTLGRLLDLPPDAVVYPGHGLTTTLGAEAGWMREHAARAVG